MLHGSHLRQNEGNAGGDWPGAWDVELPANQPTRQARRVPTRDPT